MGFSFLRRTTLDAIGGASLAIAGAEMAVESVRAYLGGDPRWLLYVYLPIATVLFVAGAVVLVAAQRRYELERGREGGPGTPANRPR